MTQVYLGLGSNLSAPIEQLEKAVKALKSATGVSRLECSSLYRSRPMGPQDQPDYVNAVVGLEYARDPISLLNCTQAIELEQGRTRKAQRWGARTLDIDILLFGEQCINTERLVIPHYGMKTREFVLLPLLELAPNLILPGGELIKELASQVNHNDLIRIKSPR